MPCAQRFSCSSRGCGMLSTSTTPVSAAGPRHWHIINSLAKHQRPAVLLLLISWLLRLGWRQTVSQERKRRHQPRANGARRGILHHHLRAGRAVCTSLAAANCHDSCTAVTSVGKTRAKAIKQHGRRRVVVVHVERGRLARPFFAAIWPLCPLGQSRDTLTPRRSTCKPLHRNSG